MYYYFAHMVNGADTMRQYVQIIRWHERKLNETKMYKLILLSPFTYASSITRSV